MRFAPDLLRATLGSAGLRVIMDAAWIAVIGTLGGVVVTSASGILLGWLTVRGLRRNTEIQRMHDVSEHRRGERREIFVGKYSEFPSVELVGLALSSMMSPPAAVRGSLGR